MPGAVVEIGDKFHIMTRRLFEEEVRRQFVGEVITDGGAFSLPINEFGPTR